MRSFLAPAALCLALAWPALARPHHHRAPPPPPAAPCFLFGCLAHATPAPSPAQPARHARRHHHHARHRAVTSGQPPACAGIAWCGCWLRLHLGISDVRLNRARAWAGIGRPANGPAPGVIAVWPHHVGIITADLGRGLIRLLSGNDGHAVRERARSTRGIIAYRRV
jgi:hypothetical protein